LHLHNKEYIHQSRSAGGEYGTGEESGVRLASIFLAIRPISKVSRIEEISRGIRSMADEELYYWFAKCSTTGTADRAQKALRILLSEE